jgi:hypothetical protein
MRIVGEQRLTGGAQGAVDDPVVRAERFDQATTEQEVAYRGVATGECGKKRG